MSAWVIIALVPKSLVPELNSEKKIPRRNNDQIIRRNPSCLTYFHNFITPIFTVFVVTSVPTSSVATANVSLGVAAPKSILTMQQLPPVKLDEKMRQKQALTILQVILDSPVVKPFLRELLREKNADGLTPFMAAVSHR